MAEWNSCMLEHFRLDYVKFCDGLIEVENWLGYPSIFDGIGPATSPSEDKENLGIVCVKLFNVTSGGGPPLPLFGRLPCSCGLLRSVISVGRRWLRGLDCWLKRTLSALIFLKDLQAGHFQMNKSDDFDEVQDISSMSVGGVVQGQVMVSLRMFLLIRKVRAVSSELVSWWISAWMPAMHWYRFK